MIVVPAPSARPTMSPMLASINSERTVRAPAMPPLSEARTVGIEENHGERAGLSREREVTGAEHLPALAVPQSDGHVGSQTIPAGTPRADRRPSTTPCAVCESAAARPEPDQR